jgi:hypothetical protein
MLPRVHFLLIFFIFLSLTNFSNAQVKETWETSFTPPWKGNQSFSRGMPPDEFTLVVILSIDKNPEGELSGNMQFTGQVRCRGIAKIEDGKISNEQVYFKTEPLPVVQCPPVTFSGKVVGDTWVGSIPWNGKENNVVFRKK